MTMERAWKMLEQHTTAIPVANDDVEEWDEDWDDDIEYDWDDENEPFEYDK